MIEKTYYLSGPMSGIPEFNYLAFEAACQHLRGELGLTVVSPHNVQHNENGVVGSLPWTEYLRKDIQEMLALGCNAIILLPGWSKSRGARLELQMALGLEMDVFFYHDGKLLSMER